MQIDNEPMFFISLGTLLINVLGLVWGAAKFSARLGEVEKRNGDVEVDVIRSEQKLNSHSQAILLIAQHTNTSLDAIREPL